MPGKAVYIAGVGMTAFGINLARSVKDLTSQAVGDALSDANCAASQVEAAWFANTSQGALEGQHMIRGQAALRPLGFAGIPVSNVENACASASTALFEAANYLQAGAADIVIAVGAEKLSHADRNRSLGIFDAGWDVSLTDESRAALLALGGMDDAALPPPAPRRSVFMDIYAAFARQHMRLYGSTAEQFAAVAAKNHAHSVHNERAQYRRSYTTAEVLADRPSAVTMAQRQFLHLSRNHPSPQLQGCRKMHSRLPMPHRNHGPKKPRFGTTGICQARGRYRRACRRA